MRTMDWIVVIVFTLAVLWLVKNFGVPLLIVELAKQDVWWSPYRIKAPPGEMKIMVKADEKGDFDSLIESVMTHDYSPITHEFNGPLAVPRTDNGFLDTLGVAEVGFFKKYYRREVRYDKWEMLPNSPDFGIVSKVHRGPSFFFRYNMAVEIKAAETKGNLPVNATIIFIAEIWNPSKAFFFAGGWEIQATGGVSKTFRQYVSNKTIDELREEDKHGTLTSTLINSITSLGGRDTTGAGNHVQNGFFALYGFTIPHAQFVLFDLVSGDRDEEMIAATRATELARLQAEADEHRGKGARRRREEEAAGIQATVEAWGSNPVGGTVAMAEAIKEAKPNVLGGSVIASVDSEKKGGRS